MEPLIDAIRRLDAALGREGFGPAKLTLSSWEDLAVIGTLGLRRQMLVGDDPVVIGGLTIDAPPRRRDCTRDIGAD
jgi:hypothetical protein